MVLTEERESPATTVGHHLVMSRNGFKFIKWQCERCKAWFEGPVFVEENGVRFLETYPADGSCAHEIVEVATAWKRRLIPEAEVPLDKICIHIQMVDLRIHPKWNVAKEYGFTQYYYSGKLVTRPQAVWHGKYDAAVIYLAPDGDRSLSALEELVCHELAHVAFPRCGEIQTRHMDDFVDPVHEKWAEKKTAQLLKRFGYVFGR